MQQWILVVHVHNIHRGRNIEKGKEREKDSYSVSQSVIESEREKWEEGNERQNSKSKSRASDSSTERHIHIQSHWVTYNSHMKICRGEKQGGRLEWFSVFSLTTCSPSNSLSLSLPLSLSRSLSLSSTSVSCSYLLFLPLPLPLALGLSLRAKVTNAQFRRVLFEFCFSSLPSCLSLFLSLSSCSESALKRTCNTLSYECYELRLTTTTHIYQ